MSESEPASSDDAAAERPAPSTEDSGAGRFESAVVLELLPNRVVLVETETGERVAAHLSGKMRIGVIRLVAGDEVRIQRSPFDPGKARIVPPARPAPGD